MVLQRSLSLMCLFLVFVTTPLAAQSYTYGTPLPTPSLYWSPSPSPASYLSPTPLPSPSASPSYGPTPAIVWYRRPPLPSPIPTQQFEETEYTVSPESPTSPRFSGIFKETNPLVVCRIDSDNDGVVDYSAEQTLFTDLESCTALEGSADSGPVVMKLEGPGSSPRIPARQGGEIVNFPDFIRDHIPLPNDHLGRKPICGNASEHLRRFLASRGHDATVTMIACVYRISIICEGFPFNKKVHLHDILFSHFVTDLHWKGLAFYIDPQNGFKQLNLDGDRDGTVEQFEPVHGVLEDQNEVDVEAGDDLAESVCGNKKPLRYVFEPGDLSGNGKKCLIASWNSRAEAEREAGMRVPRSWEERENKINNINQ